MTGSWAKSTSSLLLTWGEFPPRWHLPKSGDVLILTTRGAGSYSQIVGRTQACCLTPRKVQNTPATIKRLSPSVRVPSLEHHVLEVSRPEFLVRLPGALLSPVSLFLGLAALENLPPFDQRKDSKLPSPFLSWED